MKKYLILNTTLLLMVSALSSTGLSKQIHVDEKSSDSSKSELSGNISITLKIYSEEKLEETIAFQVLNQERNFQVSYINLNKNKTKPFEFKGHVAPVGAETYVISYSISEGYEISNENRTSSGNHGWNAVVEIAKGTEVVLMKNANYVYTLEIGNDLGKPNFK